MVEMRGVEPLSEIPAKRLSTSLVKDFGLSLPAPLSLDTVKAAF